MVESKRNYNKPIRKKMEKNGIFFLNYIILSILLAFHLINISQGLLYNDREGSSFFGSAQFVIGLIILIILFIILFNVLIKIFDVKQNEKQDKFIFLILILLLVLDFILSFQRNTNRFWLCLYNLTLSFAIGLVYYRLNVFKNEESKLSEKQLFNTLLITTGVIIIISVILGFSFHNAFFTFSDFSTFSNAIWRIGNDGSQYTYVENNMDHRAVHFQPILYLLAILYKIHCSPYILIFLQIFFTFAAAIFLYLLAIKLTENKPASFLITLSFLVSTYTFRTIINDYHPETMYMMMFFAFLYFAESGNFLTSLIFMCLSIAMKEEASVYMALASIFIFLRNRDKRYLLLSIGSFLYAFVIIKLIMPAYNPYSGGWIESISNNLSNFGNNYLNFNFCVQFFIFLASVCLLPIFNLSSLLIILVPPIIVQSAHYGSGLPLLFDIQYSAFVVPALFSSTLYTLNKINIEKKSFSKHLTLIAFLILLVQIEIHLSLMFIYSITYIISIYLLILILVFTAFTNVKASIRFPIFALLILIVIYAGYYNCYKERLINVNDKHRESINEAIKYLPKDENIAVITNTNIVPHLCCRKYIWDQEIGKTQSVLLPLIKEKLNEFYMLVYLYDFTYIRENIQPGVRNQEIFDLATKLGYKYQFVYADDITGVIKFNKQ
jgi:uncharacterized membrane protein